jgi:hypothetical protein
VLGFGARSVGALDERGDVAKHSVRFGARKPLGRSMSAVTWSSIRAFRRSRALGRSMSAVTWSSIRAFRRSQALGRSMSLVTWLLARGGCRFGARYNCGAWWAWWRVMRRSAVAELPAAWPAGAW